MWLTKQWRCILSDTDFKDFKPRAAVDASRIIIGWPTSAESLYDAFSKTSAKSCANSQHSAHFWHILAAAEKVFSRRFVEAIWLMLLSTLLSHCRHLEAFPFKSLQGPLISKMCPQGFFLLCLLLVTYNLNLLWEKCVTQIRNTAHTFGTSGVF